MSNTMISLVWGAYTNKSPKEIHPDAYQEFVDHTNISSGDQACDSATLRGKPIVPSY